MLHWARKGRKTSAGQELDIETYKVNSGGILSERKL